MAYWGIIVEAKGRPVYRLVGGKPADRVKVYAICGVVWGFVVKPELIVKGSPNRLSYCS